MLLSPSAFQRGILLPNRQTAFVTWNLDSSNMERVTGQSIIPDRERVLSHLMPYIRLDGPLRALIKMRYEPA